MVAILKRHGFAPFEASTVAEAIAGLECNPAWILLDLMLPDGSGMEVLGRVRDAGVGARVCIITGCNVDVRDDALRAGADYAMSKPLDVTALLALFSKRDDPHRLASGEHTRATQPSRRASAR